MKSCFRHNKVLSARAITFANTLTGSKQKGISLKEFFENVDFEKKISRQ